MPDYTCLRNYSSGFPGLLDDSCYPSSSGTLLPTTFTSKRGRRAGLKVKEREIAQRNKIDSIATLRDHKSKCKFGGVNPNNLIQIQTKSTSGNCLPVTEHHLVVALSNSRSLNRNGFKLKDHVVEYDCDIVGITETWLSSDEVIANQIIGDTCPEGYKMSHVPRQTGQRGGGVGILHKDCLEIRNVLDGCKDRFTSFEYSEHLLKSAKWVRLIIIYRPPPSTANGLSNTQFFSEFSMLLERVVLLPTDILILGDFNFHVDDSTDSAAACFLHLLDAFNFPACRGIHSYIWSHFGSCYN